MPRPRPFTGHLVAPGRAHAVVAPPYDALSPAQRAALAAADPESYLNALPPGPGSASELAATLERCRRSVQRFVASGLFTPLASPVLAIIALDHGSGRTVGVVGDLPADAFDLEATGAPGKVRPHERVNPMRVDQLARYLEVVKVASSPVAVMHRPSAGVDAVVAAVLDRPPQLGVRSEDDVDVTVWVVSEPTEQASIAAAIEDAGTLYLADGHHRAAAVATYATRQPAPSAGRVLTALVPSDHLAVGPFHRRLVGASDPTSDGVARRLRTLGDPVPLDGPWQPDRRGVVAVTAEGRWWRIDLRHHAERGPVEGLDVRLVERALVPALLDGGADGAETRLEPVAGPAGLRALEQPGTVGIALAAPGVEAILDVADAGASMPVKTTYVTPKLRSGIFLAPR